MEGTEVRYRSEKKATPLREWRRNVAAIVALALCACLSSLACAATESPEPKHDLPFHKLLREMRPMPPTGEGGAEKAPAAAPSPMFEEIGAESESKFLMRLSGSGDVIPLDASSFKSVVNVDEPLRLDQAIAFALQNNFEIRASEHKTETAKWEKAGAYSQYLPVVEVNLATGSERSRPASINNSNGDRVADNKHKRHDRNLSVRQPLLDLGVVADILASREKEKVSKLDHRDARESLALDTISVFLKLIQVRMMIRLTDDYKAYLDKLAARMRARVEGGGATAPDLDRIASRASMVEAVRVAAVGEYEASLSEFRQLTGVTPANLRIPEMLALKVPDDMPRALDMAMGSNPAYLSARSKIDIAKQEKRKALAGALPRFSAQYTSAYTYGAGGSAHGNPVDGLYPTQRDDSLMLVAQWALNGGTSIMSGLAEESKRQEMDMRARDTRSRIEQGIRVSYAAVNAARARQAVLRKTVETNMRVVAGFEEQYAQGARPLFDLLDAYEQLYGSSVNLLRVIFSNAEASYQIHRQMGDLVPAVIEEAK